MSVNVRIIAAAKMNLKELSDQQKFQADLYYRLNLIVLNLPPLSERREDIPELFEHYVLDAATCYNRAAPLVSSTQMHRLMAHSWPGNVRELRNIADRFVLGLLGNEDSILQQSVPESPLAEQVRHFERALIEVELRKHRGNVGPICEALGLPKQTLYHKMQKYQLVAEEYK